MFLDQASKLVLLYVFGFRAMLPGRCRSSLAVFLIW